MLAEAYTDAFALLTRHREQLDRLRERLHEQRVLARVDILAAIRPVSAPQRLTPRPTPREAPALVPNAMPLAAAQGPES